MSEKKRKTKAQRIYSVLSSRKRIEEGLKEYNESQRELLELFLNYYSKPTKF